MKEPRPTHRAMPGRFQQTRWGSFTWLHEPRDAARGRLSIAITRFNPGAYQAPHRHASEEQLIYVISGSGTSVYDGRETPLAPGVITYMHADGVHEVRASPEGLEMLMVFVPAPVEVPAPVRGRAVFDSSIVRSVLSQQSIGESVRNLGTMLDMGIVLADAAGGMALEPVNMSPECVSRCFVRGRGPWKLAPRDGRDAVVECCDGNYFVVSPAFSPASSRVQPLYLFAGPANLGPDRAVPRSRLYTAAEAIRTLANLIETAARQKELELRMAAQTLSAGAPAESGAGGASTTDAIIRNRHVSAVVSLLHENPERHVSLREAAQAVGLNPSHLSRLFRKVMGISFVRYAAFVKMARAKALLATTDLTVKEIADRLGFSSPAYFGQAFRRFEGTTPRSYRDASKNL